MVTVLVLSCYLPVGVLAVVMPIGWLRAVERVFPFLAPLPLVCLLLAWAAAAPLTAALSYGVALIPLGISLASQAIGVAGARLALHALRQGRPWKAPPCWDCWQDSRFSPWLGRRFGNGAAEDCRGGW